MRVVLALAVACLLAVAAVPAHAAPTQESILQDDNRLLYRGAEVTDATLAELAALGVTRIRLSVHWRAFAPEHRATTRPASFTDATDPGQYDRHRFDAHDHTIRVARRLGIEVLLTPTGGAPLWATARDARGRRLHLHHKPDARAFGEFVQMLGRRYDGTYRDENQGGAALPRVTAWSIWNEPNHGATLSPQYERRTSKVRGRRRTTVTATAARLYRALVRAATAGLARTGHGDDLVLLGETSPRGATNGAFKHRHAPPVPFVRDVLCLDPKLRPLRGSAARRLRCDFRRAGPLRVSAYAHHPYSVSAPPEQGERDPGHATLADIGRLTAVLDAGARRGRLPGTLPLWYTEFGYQTNPPDPTDRGLPLATQVEFLTRAERITRADPRVAAHAQFLLWDDEPRAHEPAGSARYWGTYQSGLRFADGRPKPALDAYRLPFLALGTPRAGAPLELWGLIRPVAAAGAAPAAQLEFRPAADADWQPLASVRADGPGQTFTTRIESAVAGEYRFTWRPPAPQDPPATRGGLQAPPLLGPPAPAPAPPPAYASAPVVVGVG